MDESGPCLELIEHSESGLLLCLGNLLVHVHDRQIGTVGIQRFSRAIDEVLERDPDGICILWVSHTRLTNPDERAMHERLELIRHPGERLLRLAFVTEPSGLAATMKRSAAREVREKLGPMGTRMGIFRRILEGLEYVTPYVRPRVRVGELNRQIEAVWGPLETSPPVRPPLRL